MDRLHQNGAGIGLGGDAPRLADALWRGHHGGMTFIDRNSPDCDRQIEKCIAEDETVVVDYPRPKPQPQPIRVVWFPKKATSSSSRPG